MLFLNSCQDAVSPNPVQAVRPGDAHHALGPMFEGWILRDHQPVRVVFQSHGGRAIFEGDIDLGPVETIARSREQLVGRTADERGPRYGVVVEHPADRWWNGRVPYVIESGFPNEWRVYDAIGDIQSKVAGVVFQPRSSWDSDYIVFRRTSDPAICGRSAIGMRRGAQDVWVNDNCGTPTVVHELGHAIGFWHEQSRCDRDSFVEILWGNIQSGYWDQFDQYCGGVLNLESYDESSIMHYGTTAFGRIENGVQLETIRSRRGLGHLMGNSTGFSTVDVYTTNRIYTPFAPNIVGTSYPGGVPTVSWTASNGASGYSMSLVVVYEEYNDYENTSTIFDYSTEGVGFTTGLSLQDAQRSYTGSERCWLWQETWGSASYAYYYEVVASFPNGVSSSAARWPADVAPSSC